MRVMCEIIIIDFILLKMIKMLKKVFTLSFYDGNMYLRR